jgi:hypothetical protein
MLDKVQKPSNSLKNVLFKSCLLSTLVLCKRKDLPCMFSSCLLGNWWPHQYLMTPKAKHTKQYTMIALHTKLDSWAQGGEREGEKQQHTHTHTDKTSLTGWHLYSPSPLGQIWYLKGKICKLMSSRATLHTLLKEVQWDITHLTSFKLEIFKKVTENNFFQHNFIMGYNTKTRWSWSNSFQQIMKRTKDEMHVP